MGWDFGDVFDPLDIIDTGGSLAPGRIFGQITGEAGAEASAEAARLQNEQFNQIIDLFRPFAEAGTEQLPTLTEGATVGGFGSRIGEILESGVLDPLVGEQERRLDQQFASQGLRRSSGAFQKLARLPADLAFNLENQLFGRSQGLANLGIGGITGTAGAREGLGASAAGGVLGAQQARAGGVGNLLNLGTSLLTALFSDKRLKTNIHRCGTVAGLPIYWFEWNKEARDLGLKGIGVSWLAQEVQQHYPDCVVEDESGFLKIDVDKVMTYGSNT